MSTPSYLLIAINMALMWDLRVCGNFLLAEKGEDVEAFPGYLPSPFAKTND